MLALLQKLAPDHESSSPAIRTGCRKRPPCGHSRIFLVFHVGPQTEENPRPIQALRYSFGFKGDRCVMNTSNSALSSKNSYWSYKSGRRKRGILGEVVPGSKCIAPLRRALLVFEEPIWKFLQKMAALELWVALLPYEIWGALFVADQPVGPDVGDRNFNRVLAGHNRIADIDAPGRRPHYADFLSIHTRCCQIVDDAEIEIHLAVRWHGGKMDRLLVDCGAGVVLNALFGVGCPVFKALELN